MAEAAVSRLSFHSLPSSVSSSLLIFFSFFSCLDASLRVSFLLNPRNAFPLKLAGGRQTQCPSHLPPVFLEHQYHLFPFHTLVWESCPFCGFSLLVNHLGRCSLVLWPSFFLFGFFCCVTFVARLSSQCSFSNLDSRA